MAASGIPHPSKKRSHTGELRAAAPIPFAAAQPAVPSPFAATQAAAPSPLAGEGGFAKQNRMRGEPAPGLTDMDVDSDAKSSASASASAASASASAAAADNSADASPSQQTFAQGSQYDEENEVIIPVVNPDPNDLVVISLSLLSQKLPKNPDAKAIEEANTQPENMEVDAGTPPAPAKIPSEDEKLKFQLTLLKGRRYQVHLDLKGENFSEEKTGEALTTVFSQNEVRNAKFNYSNIFAVTTLNLEVVGGHRFLHRLSLSGCQLTPTQFVSLFSGLSQSDSILALHLYGAMIGCDSNAGIFKDSSRQIFSALNQFLISNKTLERLDLRANKLTANQVRLFSDGVSQSALKQLDVSHNQIGTKGFCLLLNNFRGLVFDANYAMGAVKLGDHSAARQVYETLETNPHITSLSLRGVSHHWNSDAKIYNALVRNKSITSFEMTHSTYFQPDGTLTACVRSACDLLEAKTPLKKLVIDFPLYHPEIFQQIKSSILNNNRLTDSVLGGVSSAHKPFTQDPAVLQKMKENHKRNQTEDYNWARLALLIACVRANPNPLCTSVFPLIPIMMKAAGYDLSFEKAHGSLRGRIR